MSHLVWVYMGVKVLSMAVRSFFDTEKASVAICVILFELKYTHGRSTELLVFFSEHFATPTIEEGLSRIFEESLPGCPEDTKVKVSSLGNILALPKNLPPPWTTAAAEVGGRVDHAPPPTPAPASPNALTALSQYFLGGGAGQSRVLNQRKTTCGC